MKTLSKFRGLLAGLALVLLLAACGKPEKDTSGPDAHDGHAHAGSSAGHADEDPHDHDAHGHEQEEHDDHGAQDGHDHAAGDTHAHGSEAEGDGDEHDEHDEHGHEEGEPDFAALGPEQASAAGIVLDTATVGVVDAGLLLSGNLVIDPRRLAQVRGRFAGLIRAMHKEVGDPVRRGETLATVESNESLTTYAVSAPIAGVVLERHANAGGVSGDDPLYTIGDVGALQAELKVFPSSVGLVQPGAEVTVLIGDAEIAGSISQILPALDPGTQARRVRVALTGTPPPGLTAGQFISARVKVGTDADHVVIPLAAVKQLGGEDVVFVPGESRGRAGFRARPVQLGERGRLRVVIRRGLKAGERYVADGAFLLKAEIAKNQAAHEH
jgi:membrane fusion protein, heavy metal efflux system